MFFPRGLIWLTSRVRTCHRLWSGCSFGSFERGSRKGNAGAMTRCQTPFLFLFLFSLVADLATADAQAWGDQKR